MAAASPPKVASPTTDYAEQVARGEIVTSAWVRLACERHMRDLKNDRGLWFDHDEEQRIINFCKSVRHSKGEWAGRPVILEPWEVFILGSLFGWKRADDSRRFRATLIEIARKNGKSLMAAIVGLYLAFFDDEPGAEVYAAAPIDVGTLVPTPTGWTTMGDITVGDTVYGIDGAPRAVLAVSPVWEDRPCYEVAFDDGTTVVTDAEHLWTVDSVHLGESKAGHPRGFSPRFDRTLSTAQIGETVRTPDGRANYRIPAAGPIQADDIELPIPPYTLGAWLGDGRSNRGSLTGHPDDWQVMERVERDGYEISVQADRLLRYTARGLRTQLREAGLLENKHVPTVYMRASVAQRTALLQGLLDTDGTCTKTGEIRFTNRNEALTAAVYELAGSLGIIAQRTTRQVTGTPHWCVSFRTSLPVFHLQRKSERQVAAGQRAQRRRIVSVRSVESRPVRCISVDSPDHLFLVTNAFIATHNTKRDQAKIVWGEARNMVRKSPDLVARIRTLVGNLHVERTNSKFEPLGADADSMDGLNIHGAIIDELHAHKTRAVYDVIETATAARRQPMIFSITTAGFDRNSVCWEQHSYAVRVLEGAIEDDAFFAFIATLDPCAACRSQGKMTPSADCAECDDWRDPSVWVKANPNLGISVKVEDIARKVEKAKNVPGQVNAVLRLHMNIWTEQASRWLSMEAWDECAGVQDVSDLNAIKAAIAGITEDCHGLPCYAGLDLSSKSDVTALALWFDRGQTVDVLTFFWVPEEAVAERTRNGVPYDVWVREGFLFETSGNIIDYDVIRDFIRDEIAPNCEIQELGYDQWGATQLATQLQGDGAKVVPISQTFNALNEVCKEIEGRVMARTIRHGGHPVMRWMMSNVTVERDSQNRMRPSKTKSQEKIDGVSALCNAGARAIVREEKKASVYEDEGRGVSWIG